MRCGNVVDRCWKSKSPKKSALSGFSGAWGGEGGGGLKDDCVYVCVSVTVLWEKEIWQRYVFMYSICIDRRRKE